MVSLTLNEIAERMRDIDFAAAKAGPQCIAETDDGKRAARKPGALTKD